MKIEKIERKKGVVYQAIVDLGRDSDGKRVQRRVTADYGRRDGVSE